MTTPVFEQLREIIANTMNVSPDTITPESSEDTVDAWDSLAQVNLMMSLEQSFGIELEVEDFLKLNSVSAIVSYLEDNGVTQ